MQENEQMFQKLIDENLPMLRSAANGILNNVADADDAVQIALIKVWKHLDKFVSSAKLSTWAYTITVNTAKDIYRKKWREAKKIGAYNHELNETNLDYEIMLEKMRRAVTELSEDLATPLTMVYLSGMKPALVAEKLGTSVGMVYQKVHQAKKILRQKLGGK